MINTYSELFGPVSDSGTIDTTVLAEITTTSEEPIYTKSYPYPTNLRGEVEKQIKELLNNGVIRPSKSPYNSPLWIVPKKPGPSGEKKYRVVVDFKRLNAITIPDSYPIPDINNTLASLGECKYFTTLDLTSGFHQIRMKEKDIEKTAFSTANGKYEFTRLPFGLKNAPSIFQRMINDVLKTLIGKACYVYIDDIIIMGKTKEEHLRNIEEVFMLLHKSNLKVNLEKSKFFRTEVNFLGHIVTGEGILPDPDKISAIKKIPAPANLKELKGFLGLASYYRRFIKDFAKIVKPLTNLTRGENAQIKASQSKRIQISLTEEGLKSFNDIKYLLTSSEILVFPDFNKPFILTTDASNTAIGAVLSQGIIGQDRPITYISRSLNKTEENYSTIEKEMLAIVWSLDKLRTYLYGAKEIKILTDHQPLTFALSNSNNNAKLKRWKARIEEYNYKLIYKPGKTNVVADALSRLPIEVNTLTSTDENSQHSAEEDSSKLIPHCEAPINVFKNQVIFTEGKEEITHEEPHPSFHRHLIKCEVYNKENLSKILKSVLNPNIINGIKIQEKYISLLQQIYQENFSQFRIRITQKVVTDIADEDVKFKIIEQEHKRAHRNGKENKDHILEKYYFPQMTKLIKKYTKSCEICGCNKYDRHPQKPKLQATPIPSYPTEILHIDIIEMSGEKYISCVDKFTKFVKFFRIKNKSVLHIRDKLIKLLHYFTVPKTLVMDNEGSFISPITLNYLEGLGIEIYLAPPQKSEVNGAIERVHSTIIEIIRCLQVEYPDYSFKEIVNIAVDRYNNTIHSVTKRKPADIFFGRTQRINYQGLTNFKEIVNSDLRNEIARNQKNTLNYHNKNRSKIRNYEPGDTIFKKNKQIKGKTKPIFKKETVAKDNTVTITTNSLRLILRVNRRHR
ncbi:retrovirus-related Pol polyprotein from transposon opus isoform X1 [Bactrocera dorsalis]|uniref:RNA-directed DNA polymerase n=1 Tax=Bactrocera dorsalis TaxID=27457 RepID=A0ABM3K4A6_BACDO|nr:retrovirus-related Pol polyprotein from transposon opus isoform X1 [Bactrocera dorsalis]XP_049316308.1 retrovirus-related Pol polyprotein from transposon opus isoform X1 [Bactrocera dorsalis]XP_049316309.1 retrovirus-related Pol polyprotein from transposon opus isoform X1 [Bactrocera dorsalis]XP_049316310.1 retrovirus-related Pol polyprotein from transposon opus isoform X1 [Bactrocera dorsalis]XP_049316311.1 retrovirus-related Pol polyprotein from transposon opus isoform X1 [Bactrocera dorsa